jgi:cytochrome c5
MLLCLLPSAQTNAAAQPGDQTVQHICSACHARGLMGAPKIGDANAWNSRLKNAGSVDQLVQSAARGKGNMPPRGGQTELTDDDLRAAIQYMISRSGS